MLDLGVVLRGSVNSRTFCRADLWRRISSRIALSRLKVFVAFPAKAIIFASSNQWLNTLANLKLQDWENECEGFDFLLQASCDLSHILDSVYRVFAAKTDQAKALSSAQLSPAILAVYVDR